MSKTHENAGRLGLTLGNKAYDAKNYSEAEKAFQAAINEYSKATTSSVVTENLGKAYINLSASLIVQSKLDEALVVLKEADGKGFKSHEFAKNFAIAYYNLGLNKKGTDLDAAISAFQQAKTYDSEDANILYNLGLVLLEKKQHAEAKAEFSALLGKGFSDAQFSSALKLNSYCKLIECQLALNEDIIPVVNLASTMFAGLDVGFQAAHQEEAAFIYNRLIKNYLANNDDAKATTTLQAIESNIPGIATKIIKDLEQYALHLNSNGQQKAAMTMLLNLAHVQGGLINADFLEVIKNNLTAMSDALGKGAKSEEFVSQVLGDIASCDYHAIDDLFA